MSAVGFAYLAGIVGQVGSLTEGHRFAKLALEMLDKFQNNEIAGQVICMTAEILSFVEPFQGVNECRRRGVRVSEAAGGMFDHLHFDSCGSVLSD